jgi:hypothetical protein
MPFLKLNFRPGINKDTTNYANEGGWFECDKIRFFSGFPQKIGGWVKTSPTAFLGACRQMWNWITSYQDNFLALGTNKKVYIEVGGIFYDITPLRTTLTTSATDDCIETTNASNIVTINVTGHGCLVGDYVTISGVTGDVGGIPDAEINTEHTVESVPNADSFTIVVTSAATSTVAGGGGNSISIACQISPGFAFVTEGYGWGSGTWDGDYGWGLASSEPVFLPQRDWFFDNFDNDLVMNIRSATTSGGAAVGGPIYYWERGTSVNPATVLATPAVLLSTLSGADSVPDAASQILISQNDKHLLAFGAQPYLGSSGDFDPLLIRWASQDEPMYWNPTGVTPNGLPSSAGFLRVSRGSRIVKAIPTRQEILTFTDTHMYSLQFLGTTEVFGLQELSDNISIMGPRAIASVNNVTYWMGLDKFYAYDGRIQTLPCTLREYVFKDINATQGVQVICGTNEGFNEVWWFYCSGASNTVDRYVIYNHLDQVWYYGNLDRTAWLDVASRSLPVAVDYDSVTETGFLYTHELGVNDDNLPMAAFIQSSDFDIGDGEQFMLSRRIIPDINFNTSTASAPEVNITVRSRDWPGSNFQNDPSDTQRVIESSVGVYTNQVYIRARGRQMALKIESDDLGVQWQLGSPRLDTRQDGKR